MVTRLDGSPHEEEVVRLRAALAERQRQMMPLPHFAALYTKTRLDDILRETLRCRLRRSMPTALSTTTPKPVGLCLNHREPDVAAVIPGAECQIQGLRRSVP